MASLKDLAQYVRKYEIGQLSLDDFADEFYGISRVMFGGDEALIDACLSVEDAIYRLRYEGLNEQQFRQELANAVHPFALQWSESPAIQIRTFALSTSPEVKVYFEGGAEVVLDARVFREAFGFRVEDIAYAEDQKPSKKLIASASRPAWFEATA